MTDRSAAEAWVAAYRRAWTSNDPADIEGLFAADALYRPTPFARGWRGRREIVEGWLARRDPPGSWSLEHEIVAVEGDVAVVRAEIAYPADGRRWSNLWVVRFAADGRAGEFTEWWVDGDAADPGEPVDA